MNYTPVSVTLTQDEADELIKPVGSGGQQSLHQMLISQLKNGNLTITLNDDQLGRLIRYMGYGSGGFQSRLKKTFRRTITDRLS